MGYRKKAAVIYHVYLEKLPWVYIPQRVDEAEEIIPDLYMLSTTTCSFLPWDLLISVGE